MAETSNIHKNVDIENVHPNFLIERMKNGRLTIKNNIPQDQLLKKEPKVAIPAVPPKVSE